MISRREAILDRSVLRLLKDRAYIAQRRDAWRRCVEIDRQQAQAATAAALADIGWWTPERERQMVAHAELEGARVRELKHAAAMRKPAQSETSTRQIRRVK